MSVLAILSLLFAAAAVFGTVSRRWLRLPVTVGTMLLTVLVSAALMLASGVAPGIHGWALQRVEQIDFASLILHGMLPLLLFAGAFLLDLEDLAREKLAVSVLAIGGTLICFVLVSLAMGFSSGGRLPWIECLLFGALLSPTDPIAVLEMLRRVGVSRSIQAQLAGESLFNDGVGAVIFLTVLAMAQGQSQPAWQIGLLGLAKGCGGLLLGVAAAWAVSQLMRRVSSHEVDILYTIALALGGYALAEGLHLSAPLEAVAAGIALRTFNRHQPEEWVAHEKIDSFWELIDEIQNAILFVLLGLEAIAIPLDGVTMRWGVTAIVLVNGFRLLAVWGLLWVVRLIQREHQSSALVLGWGGLRGGLSIALALTVPEGLGRQWIVGATYIVVVFSVVVQGSTMNGLLRRLKGAEK